MRLSGVDPSIIRELSGIYKPFVKAFKELVSNAHDADAQDIFVCVAEDFSTIEVQDDGTGMTPFGFHEDFTRLGGSTAWTGEGLSPGGRPRIGSKGIGFLAVARYCSQLQVVSQSRVPYRGEAGFRRRNRKFIPFSMIAGELVPTPMLSNRLTVDVLELRGGRSAILEEGIDFLVDACGIALLSKRARSGQDFRIRYAVDCSHIRLTALLDFDYLLGLQRRADLRVLDDFCAFELEETDEQSEPGTIIRLRGLKEFVARELSAPALKGKARNIAFKSGRDQFLWRLARSSPIVDDHSVCLPRTSQGDGSGLDCTAARRLATLQGEADLPTLRVQWRNEQPVGLRRPVYVPKKTAHHDLEDTAIEIDIRDSGLRAVGYLLPQNNVIYPAELRGISVRVRNVTIGDAGYFGWETMMSGAQKAAMNQVTGEVLVLEGLDAADAINPGRESFYAENEQYRALHNALFGSGESIGGHVKTAIKSILERIHVRSQVQGKLTDAKARRKCLTDIGDAVSHFRRQDPEVGRRLARFFSDSTIRVNGLSERRDYNLRPGHMLAGFKVVEDGDLRVPYDVDFANRQIRLNYEQDLWRQDLYIGGQFYRVVLKHGRAEHPICEFDNQDCRVYVNWGHPVKLNMDDVAFLKTAILLRLANHAAPDDADTMMHLALNMIAFRAEQLWPRSSRM